MYRNVGSTLDKDQNLVLGSSSDSPLISHVILGKSFKEIDLSRALSRFFPLSL